MLDTQVTCDGPHAEAVAFPVSAHALHLCALSALITDVPPLRILGSGPVVVHLALKFLIRCPRWDLVSVSTHTLFCFASFCGLNNKTIACAALSLWASLALINHGLIYLRGRLFQIA